jgi:hypothetical protein
MPQRTAWCEIASAAGSPEFRRVNAGEVTDEKREPEEEEPEAPDAEPAPDPECVSADVVVPANAAVAADVLAGTDRTD